MAQAVPVRVRLWVPLTITMHIFLRIRHISFYKKSLLVAFLLPSFSPMKHSFLFHFLFYNGAPHICGDVFYRSVFILEIKLRKL